MLFYSSNQKKKKIVGKLISTMTKFVLFRRITGAVLCIYIYILLEISRFTRESSLIYRVSLRSDMGTMRRLMMHDDVELGRIRNSIRW